MTESMALPRGMALPSLVATPSAAYGRMSGRLRPRSRLRRHPGGASAPRQPRRWRAILGLRGPRRGGTPCRHAAGSRGCSCSCSARRVSRSGGGGEERTPQSDRSADGAGRGGRRLHSAAQPGPSPVLTPGATHRGWSAQGGVAAAVELATPVRRPVQRQSGASVERSQHHGGHRDRHGGEWDAGRREPRVIPG